jgi:sodium-dependent dicarboxylate transporter 2/3/5
LIHPASPEVRHSQQMNDQNENVLQVRLKTIGFVVGPTVFFMMLLLFDPVPEKPEVGSMAAVAALMAILWLTECLPLAVTSLIPMICFPLLGIATTAETTGRYFNPIMSLFIGAFLIALAMEKWNLHRRVALFVVLLVGTRPHRLILGFLLASAGLSMWISNTATASMMLPIALAVILKMEESMGKERAHAISVILLLAVAYGASLGGVATLVGTPTNLAFVQIFSDSFPDAPPIDFSRWFMIGLPYSVVMLGIVWWILARRLPDTDTQYLDTEDIHREYGALGPMSWEERIVSGVFFSAALLWMFRKDLSLGFTTVPGWSNLWAPLRRADDGTVALFLALILFVVPAADCRKNGFILDRSAIFRLPWDIILLIGGGFALAYGFATTGLGDYLASVFSVVESIPGWVVIALICLTITFLTELTSNVATIQMFLPVLAALAVAQNVNPLLFMVPATVSASMAFMMPVATPPNAIVFGSQRLQIIDMARVGLAINLIGVALTTIAAHILVPLVFETELGSIPAWAQ